MALLSSPQDEDADDVQLVQVVDQELPPHSVPFDEEQTNPETGGNSDSNAGEFMHVRS